MILVSYDGSVDAQTAIDSAAALMPGAPATVLTVWEPYIDALVRGGSLGIGAGMGMAGSFAAAEEIDRVCADTAFTTATEGAERATAAGLLANPMSHTRRGAIADTILAAAVEVDAVVVVVGTRGLSGVKSLVLGSVSHAVVHHADRPVLVVPSPAVVEQRREGIDRAASHV